MDDRNEPTAPGDGVDLTQPLGPADAATATHLVSRTASLILASSDRDGEPLASYAPYVACDGALYVFVSRLAAHHANLELARPVSVMIIDDEARSPQVFARLRLTMSCVVNRIEREDAHFARVLDALERRFGNIVATLRGLADFELQVLRPTRGTFVQGFGRAHRLDATELAGILRAVVH